MPERLIALFNMLKRKAQKFALGLSIKLGVIGQIISSPVDSVLTEFIWCIYHLSYDIPI